MSKIAGKAMEALGFKSSRDIEVKRRMYVAVSAFEKRGKSHFALTAPDPIVLFNLDVGLEGVIHKFQDKDVMVMDLSLNPETASVEWDKFKVGFGQALRMKEVRTVIVDTETELWELVRLARFGRTTQVMPYQYGPVNAEYRTLLKLAYESDKNLVLVRKRRPVYINDKRTKESEAAGFGDIVFNSQINCVMERDDGESPPEFCLTIEDCRQNPEAIGQVLCGAMCSWEFLEMLVLG